MLSYSPNMTKGVRSTSLTMEMSMIITMVRTTTGIEFSLDLNLDKF